MTAPCRRAVLKGVVATCGAGLLAACGGGEQSAAPPAAPAASSGGAPPGGGGLRASLAQLADIPEGGALEVSDPDGKKVLLTQPEPGVVAAFSAVCPHEGCTVAPADDGFACPCHGSQFDLDGSVRRGPAESDLRTYDVRVVDGQVLPA